MQPVLHLPAEEKSLVKPVADELVQTFSKHGGPLQDAYEAMIGLTPIAPGLRLEEVSQGWWLRPGQAPTDRAILYLHGGGYTLGSARCYRGLASQIAIRAGLNTLVAEYPLAPEHPFPAAYDTVLELRRWPARASSTPIW